MHAPTLPLSSLVLATGLLLPAAPQQKKWDPFFDYTNLPPTNEEHWGPLQQAQVQMEQALELAEKTENAAVYPLVAELKNSQDGMAWHLELFVGSGLAQPKRVNLLVSSAEPKVVRRVELLAMAPDEAKTWAVQKDSQVSWATAILLSKERLMGDKAAGPIVVDPRARKMVFLPVAGAPSWDCEVLALDPKVDKDGVQQKEEIRRFSVQVNAAKHGVKRKKLLDRFVGVPLRDDEPTELENGLYIYDFTVGEGELVTAESKVKVNYRLFLLDTTMVHDTWTSKLPETFVVPQAPLKGMSQGMVGMRVGGSRKIIIPYALAFGEAGNEIAPPKAMIVCDLDVMELLSE